MDYAGSSELDELDLLVLQALDVDGRVPLRQVATLLGVSAHTVSRRYQRLRSIAKLRVVGEPRAPRVGQSDWLIRVSCTPDTAMAVAEALAGRHDTAWVTLSSGGTEITCVLRASSVEQRDQLLLRKLPHTPRIVSMTAHQVLHVFVDTRYFWVKRLRTLRPDQVETIEELSGRVDGAAPTAPPPAPNPVDDAIIGVLAHDGRAGFAELAAAAGCSETTARRRLEELRRSGVIGLEIEVDGRVLGFDTGAMLWLTVSPAELDAVGTAMARHVEAPFVAATTGPTNLVCSVTCRDAEELYQYVSRRIGSLGGVRQIETSPRIRTLKMEGRIRPPVRRTGRSAV